MGLQIASGNGDGSLARVDPTALAIRSLLYGADGNPMHRAHESDIADARLVESVAGRVFPGKRLRALRTDQMGGLRAGNDVPLFRDFVLGSTLNASIWTTTATTMAAAQASNVITLNSASTTTSSTGIILVSRPRFPHGNGKLLRYNLRAQLRWGVASGAAGSNTAIQAGFGAPASQTALALTDGLVVRLTSTGALQVLGASGTNETTPIGLGTLTAGVCTPSGTGVYNPNGKTWSNAQYYNYYLTLGEDWGLVQCVDPLDGKLVFEVMVQYATNVASALLTSHAQVFAQVLNTASAVTNASQVFIAKASLDVLDGEWGLSQNLLASMNDLSPYVSPTAFTQLANYANSAAPSSATLSNTAAGYTTFGGQFQFAAVAGAETDYCLFGPTVPAPFRFYCTGARIALYNGGSPGAANSATVPTTCQWAIGADGASVNLSTGGFMRGILGTQSIPVNAVVGQNVADLDARLPEPMITNAGRILAGILKISHGAATASQIIRGSFLFRGFFF